MFAYMSISSCGLCLGIRLEAWFIWMVDTNIAFDYSAYNLAASLTYVYLEGPEPAGL